MRSSKVFAPAFACFAACLLAASLHATSLMENLGRGVVAVRTGAAEAFVSWRMLGTDPSDVAFNVYRATGAAAPQLLNASPLTGATHFSDAGADPAQANAWFVRSIVFGIEQPASAAFTLAANAPVLPYLRIPLQRPANGVTPNGEGYSYTPNDTSVGDLDGDGEYELVLKWEPTNTRDSSNDGFTGNTYLDAYRLDGTRLWRIDMGVNIRAGAHDTPFIVYDFDGDGRSEVVLRTAAGSRDGLGNVIADPAKFSGPFPSEPFSHASDYRNSSGRALVGPEFLTVFDGLTGAELTSTKFLPARHPTTDFPTSQQLFDIWGDTSGNRQGRFYPPGVAYLDGQRPSIVMGRGYATGQNNHPGRIGVAAWNWRDGQLTPLWEFDTRGRADERSLTGQGAHNASVADLNGDGKDDIVYGQLWLRHDGTVLHTGWGHGDALHVSNMDPDRPGQQVFMPHESPGAYGPNALSYEHGATGELLFGVQASTDIGRGNAADIDPRFRGYEMWGSGGTGGLYNVQHATPNAVLGPRGVPVSSTKPNQINHVVWWDGDLLRELLDGTTVSKWNWNSGSSGALMTTTGLASNNGTKSNPGLQADILGDWREEIIWRETNNDAIRIYTTTIPTAHRFPTLMHDRQYRSAIAWQNVGYNQPPHPAFYLGDGMNPLPPPDIVTSLGTLLGPPPPVFTAIADDAGASATDFITNDATLVLHGTATENTTVTLTRLGVGVIGTAPVDADGNWSFDYTGTTLPSGESRFTGTTTSGAGTGAPSAPFSITVDPDAPAAPVITDISSTSTLHFAGTAEPGSTVTVVRQGFGAVGTAVATASGNWSLDYAGDPLPPGAHSFVATATDVAGNSSAASAPSSVDTTVATPTITGVSQDTGVSTTDAITSDSSLVFNGTAGPGNTVTLTRLDAGIVGSALADPTGQWAIDVSGNALADGTYFFTARASTGSGAASPSSATLVTTIDTATPGVVSVNRFNPAVAVSAAGAITFRVTFTEAAAAVGPADFTPVFSGGLSGSITDVSAADATNFDVTVSLTGEGTVRLDVNAGGIQDLAGNALPVAFTTGQVYTRSLTGDGVWIQADSGALWSTNANWENGIVGSGVGTTADFSTLDVAEDITVQLDAPRTVGNLVFGDTDISTPGSWHVAPQGAATLTLAVAGGSPTVQVNPLGLGATVTIGSSLAGNQGINKAGTGVLVVTNANPLSGAHNINAGTLRIAPGATQTATSVNVASGGASLDIAGGDFTATGTTTANGGGSVVINAGTATFQAVNTNNSANGLIRVNGGTFSASSINLPRSSDATASFSFGFVVTGGAASVSGPVSLGTNNSWGSMSIQGGVVTIGGPISVGFMSGSGARGGQMRVTGGEFHSTNTTDGLIIGRRSTSGTSSGNAFFLGGVSSAEKIQMGFGPVTGGSASLTVNGGTLYLGSGGIVKSGPAGYPTTVNLQSGILAAKAAWSSEHAINLPSGGNITLRAANALNEPVDITLSGALSGNGSLTKDGSGVLTLAGENTFAGSLHLAAGALRLTGSLAGGGVVNLNGGTLAGAGTIQKPVVLNTATIAPDGATSVTLDGPSLTWNSGGRLAVAIGASGVSGRLVLSGALVKGTGGLFEVALSPGDGFAAGNTYTLATFGSTTFAAGDFVATGLPPGYVALFSVAETGLQVTVKAVAPIALADLEQFYDGTPRIPTAITDPAGLGVVFTYDGSATAPVLPGTYAVVGTIDDPVYAGSASGTLVVTTTAVVRHAPTLNADVEGSIHLLLPENVTLNGAMVSGDLLVPGTPTIVLNGSALYGTTVDATGSEIPTNRTITLNSNTVLRHVVRRVDALDLPSVIAPPPPEGTRNITLNDPSADPGDFATLRNLTLNNGGYRAIPPGTYGAFVANGTSGFILGDAASTQPAIYNLQSLTLNGASVKVQVVGPVVLTLGNGVSFTGTVGATDAPQWLIVHVASGDVTLNNGGVLHGRVVAPTGVVTINSGATLNGSVVSDRLTLNGSGLLREAP